MPNACSDTLYFPKAPFRDVNGAFHDESGRAEVKFRELVVFPREITSTYSGRFDIRGRAVYCLNSWLPYRQSNASGADYPLFALSFDGWSDATGGPFRPQAIRLHGGLKLFRPEGFSKIYIKSTPPVFVSGTWTFSQYDFHCTPLYFLIADDLILDIDRNLTEPVYSYGVYATEPAATQTAGVQFFGSSRAAKKKIIIQIYSSWTTTVQYSIYADCTAGQFLLYTVSPSTFPYYAEHEIPSELTNDIYVSLQGGGTGGGAGYIYVTYLERMP